MISKTLLILFQMLQSDWLHYRFLFASSELLQIPPFDWLRYSLFIGDRPLVAKGIDFQIQGQWQKTRVFRHFNSFL